METRLGVVSPIKKGNLQKYPRTEDLLAEPYLFPRQNPPIPDDLIASAIRRAYERSLKTKGGDKQVIMKSPEELVKLCISHLKERGDPILSTYFYSQIDVDDVFDMDAIAHEMQRQRMKIGNFYQYLLIELMRAAQKSGKSNIIAAFDGTREGDAVADIKTPGFDKNLRLYISVKKSSDTVGGQDVPGVISRLESVALEEKNLTSPYLCVMAIATPPRGRQVPFEKARSIKYSQRGDPYSLNCEMWLPNFLFPYITGHEPTYIYNKCIEFVDLYLPFHSLKARKEATQLLKEKFVEMGIADKDGKILKEKFFEFMVS